MDNAVKVSIIATRYATLHRQFDKAMAYDTVALQGQSPFTGVTWNWKTMMPYVIRVPMTCGIKNNTFNLVTVWYSFKHIRNIRNLRGVFYQWGMWKILYHCHSLSISLKLNILYAVRFKYFELTSNHSRANNNEQYILKLLICTNVWI